MLPKFPIRMSALCLLAGALSLAIVFHSPKTTLAADSAAPSYTKNGELLLPADYRDWTYLTTGIDMSYTPKPPGMQDHSMFDNLFVNTAAYRSFLDTGTWPDKTVFVLEAREAPNKGSINQNGHFQAGGVMDLEFHVKDEARSPGNGPSFQAIPPLVTAG